MDITQLIDYDTLRAVLTVSVSELPDALLESYHVEDDVAAELDERVPEWGSIADEKPLRQLRLFAKYAAAATVAVTASVFVLKKETDGNNEGQRSDKDGFAYISVAMRAKAEAALSTLLDLLNMPEGVDYAELLTRSPPNRDIITTSREDV